MPLIAVKIFVGFLVGTLIGMTGLGGGVLLLPILIFGLRIPAIIAVGSDALFNFFTKIPAGWVHLHKGTVRRKVVVALAMGSVPGSILGVALLTHIRSLYGSGVNDFIKSAVGLLLVVIPTLLLFQSRIEDNLANRPPTGIVLQHAGSCTLVAAHSLRAAVGVGRQNAVGINLGEDARFLRFDFLLQLA